MPPKNIQDHLDLFMVSTQRNICSYVLYFFSLLLLKENCQKRAVVELCFTCDVTKHTDAFCKFVGRLKPGGHSCSLAPPCGSFV